MNTPAPFDLPVEMIDYRFPLRPDLLLRLELPADLTEGDVERLQRWMRTLCFVRHVRTAVASSPGADAPAPPLPELPPAPARASRLVPRVYMMAGGEPIDLWGTALATHGSSREHDAARIVAGDLEPWAILEPFVGQEPHVGSFGGTMAADGEIVSYKSRAVAVLLHSHGIRGRQGIRDESTGGMKLGDPVPITPATIHAIAPVGTKILRVAWACAAQPLKLLEHDKIPASSCVFQLEPTEPVTELDLFFALWVG